MISYYLYGLSHIHYCNLKGEAIRWENLRRSEYIKYLTVTQIKPIANKIDWKKVSERRDHLSPEVIDEFSDRVNWWWVSRRQSLPEDLIRKYQDKVNWLGISINQTLSEDFIREFRHRVKWHYISRHQKLSLPFIASFASSVNWDQVSGYQVLTEDFVEEFADSLLWTELSRSQKFSIPFLEKHQDRIDWFYASKNHELSEKLIEDREIYSYYTCKYQVLSEAFIEKHIDKLLIHIPDLVQYQEVSFGFLMKYQDRINWKYVSKKTRAKFDREEMKTYRRLKKEYTMNYYYQ